MVDLRRALCFFVFAAAVLGISVPVFAQDTTQTSKNAITEEATPPPTLEPIRKPGSPPPFVAFSVPAKQTPAQPAPPPVSAPPAQVKPAQPTPPQPQSKIHRLPSIKALWHRFTQSHHKAIVHPAAVIATPPLAPVAPKPVVVVAPPPVHETPKPVAPPVTVSAPVHVAAQPAPAPVAAKPAAMPPAPSKPAPTVAAPPAAPAQAGGPLDAMTRDGSVPAAQSGDAPVSPVTQALKAVGALVIGLLVVFVAVHILRRYRGVIEGFRTARAAQTQPDANGIMHFPADFAALLSGQSAKPAPPTKGAFGSGSLEVLNAQSLPGSGSIVYLVKAADRMLLLGASHQGGVRTLAEWDIEETTTAAERDASFDAYLEAQGVTKTPPPVAEVEVRAVRARLHDLTGRLAQHLGQDSEGLE